MFIHSLLYSFQKLSKSALIDHMYTIMHISHHLTFLCRGSTTTRSIIRPNILQAHLIQQSSRHFSLLRIQISPIVQSIRGILATTQKFFLAGLFISCGCNFGKEYDGGGAACGNVGEEGSSGYGWLEGCGLLGGDCTDGDDCSV